VPLFANERVWAPDKKWANSVISEVASAPKGQFNDLCDTASAALTRMRDHGLLSLARSSGVTSAGSSSSAAANSARASASRTKACDQQRWQPARR
jgi:hypothetical protein